MDVTPGRRLDNLSASASPTVTDDSTKGYSRGSMWYDATGDAWWILSDATGGAAAWHQVVVPDISGTVNIPFTRAVLAAAGSSQSDAAQISKQFTIVTGSDATKGVALPAAATTGAPIFIFNDANVRLNVYPINGGDDQINAVAANGAFQLQGGMLGVFVPTSATQWYSPTNGAAVLPRPTVRTTVANAGTITVAGLKGGVLFQDASAGNVTMTTPTATNFNTNFPELRVGDGFDIWVASNHATNTSTIAGGTNVTLVGSGAVTNTGGQFKIIKTASTTYDLVRVG